MNIFKELKNKNYRVPEGISQNHSYKRYKTIIENGWGKYLDALTRCGPFSMRQQFEKLVKILESKKNLSDDSVNVLTTLILRELEDLKFISTDYLNNQKYIYLRKPTYTLIAGEHNHSYKVNFKKDFNNNTFMNSILKVEYLLNYNEIIDYSNMHNQLYMITKKFYNFIIQEGNSYNYNLSVIERILSICETNKTQIYRNVIKFINTTSESQAKLGIIRTLWTYLGKEYWKIGRQKETISKKPYYLQLNLLKNGEITIHYIVEIIMFDTNKSLDYYQSRNNTFFYMFFNMPDNHVKGIVKNYKNNHVLGNEYNNIFAYKVKIVGFDKETLIKKTDIINEPYKINEYSPMAEKCEYIFLDMGNSLIKEGVRNSSLFVGYETKIENLIEERLNQLS